MNDNLSSRLERLMRIRTRLNTHRSRWMSALQRYDDPYERAPSAQALVSTEGRSREQACVAIFGHRTCCTLKVGDCCAALHVCHAVMLAQVR